MHTGIQVTVPLPLACIKLLYDTVIIKQMKIQITPQHRHSVAINKYYCLVQEVQSNPHALIKKVIILFILLNMSYLSTAERPAGFCILVTN